ncbi:hypothetical protein [Leucobacter luti]|uniref:hypothetical protein n=1 Tax=Leucobacter luti TaxID=340320 RepID=UPI001C68FFBC|nr:hypothetical protein [Leucobacter luti]QYM76122.1 hypothetical protein K1X41_01120 [Leucobacter luti]
MPPLPLPIRILTTWGVILPLALLAQWALSPLTETWHPVLRLTATISLVVPIAVTWGLPLAMRAAASLGRTRRKLR